GRPWPRPGENSTTGRGDEFVSFLGTSSATPVASGIAALCLTAAPETSPGQLVQTSNGPPCPSQASPSAESTPTPPCARWLPALHRRSRRRRRSPARFAGGSVSPG